MSMPIYYDASHIVHFGLETAVGVVRVDHYVAESLARDPGLHIHFMVFDTGLGGFRLCNDHEVALIDHILFHRYQRGKRAPAEPYGDVTGTSFQLRGDDASVALTQARGRRNPTVDRVRRGIRMSWPEFDHRLTTLAGRVIPVKRQHSVIRRVTTRLVRRAALIAARSVYNVASRLVLFVEAAARADPAPTGVALLPEAATLCGHNDDTRRQMIAFSRGAIVLSMGNCWDYLDYAYLHRICQDDGVSFVSVIYDVIAMQFPYTTPSPLDIYHRHWVEIGHCAAHLLAISAFSAAQYARYIGEPNDLSPALTYAHLPDFLRDRADEIGETSVARLLGRRFVLFCSTIETRKNHQLLIQLWDRLRLEFDHDRLPILVFVGKWGWGTETVRLLSERNFHLRSCLLILNRVSDAELIWLYRHALVSLFPALSEGYGLGAAESLSFGTPVVISACPALVEATEGLMPAHDPLDFMAWLEELRSLLRDERRLDELRRAAARYRGPQYDEFAGAVRAIATALAAGTRHDLPQRLAAD